MSELRSFENARCNDNNFQIIFCFCFKTRRWPNRANHALVNMKLLIKILVFFTVYLNIGLVCIFCHNGMYRIKDVILSDNSHYLSTQTVSRDSRQLSPGR